MFKIVTEIEESCSTYSKQRMSRCSLHSSISDNLLECSDAFEKNDSLLLLSRYYIAKGKFKTMEHQDCREQLVKCLNLARRLENQNQLFKQSYDLFIEVNKRIQINQNNLFVFAKSSPVKRHNQDIKEFII